MYQNVITRKCVCKLLQNLRYLSIKVHQENSMLKPTFDTKFSKLSCGCSYESFPTANNYKNHVSTSHLQCIFQLFYLVRNSAHATNVRHVFCAMKHCKPALYFNLVFVGPIWPQITRHCLQIGHVIFFLVVTFSYMQFTPKVP